MADIGINLKIAGEQVVIGALRSVGGAMINLAGAALSGAVGAFGDLASAAVAGNAEFERYETQFGVLLGSVDAAKDRLADLAEFGAKTPFELPEVVRADKILQAFGLHAEDTAERFGYAGTDIRTIAGDVAAGTGASFEEISTYLGKFASGSTGEAISRMQELGIVTRQELAGMGLEFSKSGELVSPLDESMQVLLTAMEGKFGGMMDAQSGTFEGMMSNFEDFKAGLIRTIGAPIFEVAKEGLGKLLEFLNSSEAQAGIQAFADGLAGMVQILTDFVMTIMGQTDPTEKFLSLWESVSEMFGSDVADQVVGVAKALMDIGAAIGAFIEIAAGGDIGGAFDALGEFDSLRAIFDALGIDISEVGGIVEDFAEAVLAWITGVAVPAFQNAVKWVQDNWPAIQKAIADGWAAAQPVLQAIWDFIQTVVIPGFQAAVQWVVTNWPMIQAKIAEVWAAAQPILQAAWNFLQTVVIPGFQSVVDWIVVNWPTIYATIQTIMTNVQTVINTILSAIQAFWDTWGTTIMQIVDLSFAQIKTIFEIFSAAFSGDWHTFGEKLREGFDRIWAAITLIVQTAIDWFLKQDWGAIGKDIIAGIQGGVTDAAGALAQAAIAAAKAAFDAAKGFLGIQSPSKLFRGLGTNMMAGMAQGILGGVSQPVGAVRSAVSSLTSAVTNNSGGNTYNYYGVQANMQYAYTRAVAGAF